MNGMYDMKGTDLLLDDMKVWVELAVTINKGSRLTKLFILIFGI